MTDTPAAPEATPEAAPEATLDPDTEHLAGVRAMMAANTDSLMHRMGIEIVEAIPGRLVGTMPVAGNTQTYGLLHGGASVVLAESLGSVGSAAHAYPDRIAVGVDINATHHRSARDGLVTGVATRVAGGRTLVSYEVVVSDADGRRVCTSRITCLLRDAVPG